MYVVSIFLFLSFNVFRNVKMENVSNLTLQVRSFYPLSHHVPLTSLPPRQQQESGKVPEQTHYALVQLTGTLRHVSSCQRTFPLLLVTGAVPQVCSLLHHFSHDQDVTANVVRILR